MNIWAFVSVLVLIFLFYLWKRKFFTNVFKIEDLKTKLLITVGFVAIYRFGTNVILPGIDSSALAKLHEQTGGGLLSLLDMFSGGAFSNASIFALGIMPYISASIVVQLLTMVVPSFQKMQREGESGRRKINQITRYLTIIVLVIQAPAYLTNLRLQAPGAINPGISPMAFFITSTIILAAGSMFILWLGERITDKGIGNGISFIILIGIIARFPTAISQEFIARMASARGGGLVMFLFEIIALFFVFMAAIMLTQGVRKIPVQYAKQISGGKQFGGARQYIPLKVNAANVMPIIFAQAIMFIPITLAGFGARQDASGFSGWITRNLGDMNGIWYNVIYFLMIVAFTYFYTAITVRPTQMAEEMKKNSGFIPGVKPGKKTAEYLDSIMSRMFALPGYRRHSAGICPLLRRQPAVRPVLRWNLTAHHRRCRS